MTNSNLVPYKVVPLYDYDTDTWSERSFDTLEEFRDFILSIFIEPGKIGFDECSRKFNEQARNFNEKGYYCNYPVRSKGYVEYWDDQKNKCRNGVIFKHKDKTWYITREYYMWINFLPIYDKISKKFKFPDVWDGQYYMALYELLAELHFKHVAVIKKRQFGSSYYHIAKLINQYWFEEGAVLKLGASLKDYINEKGSWKFLDEYRNFLNEHTAWYRHNDPDKALSWQQRFKVRINGRDTYKGLKSVIVGTSFEKDPTNSVGGPCTYFFHEEAGIAPKMDVTYEYIRPALQSGMVTTGTFIAAGSVGDLDQCEPLKKMILDPVANDIFPVESDLLDKNKTFGKHGLFIPEQWCMPPYIDEYGNSLVEEAIEAILIERERWKKDLDPETYQLRVSQKPINIEEAFAIRKEPLFPAHLVNAQLRKIEEGEYPCEYVDLYMDETGKIKYKKSNKQPIKDFPVPKKLEDKEGAVCIWEHPIKDAPWGTYYASIDPVGEGRTVSSDSLCSIIIYKNDIEIIEDRGEGDVKSYVDNGKIVATWCGRFDDIKKTHERLELMIRYYNAWTVVENNISLFIQYMISRKLQKYLVKKDQLLFLKEINSNANVFAEYGWKNTGTIFKNHLLSYAIEFTKEELSADYDENGKAKNVHFGIERIPDPMILKEMLAYQHGLNVDRLVAFSALVAFVTVQSSNRGAIKKVNVTEDSIEKSQNFSKLSIRSPFSNIGGYSVKFNPFFKPKSGFKNLR